MSPPIRSAGDSQLGFGLLETLPFPIAYPCRQVLAVKDAGNIDQLARLQGLLVEAILAYLGCVSLALLPSMARPLLRLNPKELWKPGMTAGKWRNVIQAACDQLRPNESSCGDRIKQLRIEQNQRGFGKLVAELIAMRNDYHHITVSGAHEEHLTQLAELLPQLSFLSDYELVRVEHETRSRHGKRVLFVESLMGAHPRHLVKRMEWFDPETQFNADDVYVLIDGRAYEFFPFGVIWECERHDRNELCFLDKVTEDGPRYLTFAEREEHTLETDAEEIYGWFAGQEGSVREAADHAGTTQKNVTETPFVDVGEEVVVSVGQMASQRGHVEAVSASEGVAQVSFNVLGEVVPVQLRLDDLAKVPKPRGSAGGGRNLTELILLVLGVNDRPLMAREIAVQVSELTGRIYDKSEISRWISDSSILRARLRRDEHYRWSLLPR